MFTIISRQSSTSPIVMQFLWNCTRYYTKTDPNFHHCLLLSCRIKYTKHVTFRLPAPLQKLHDWACHHEGVLLLITVILLLRLPNLAEPYWYGDEAIYLAIGTALRNGSVLYQDIIDHKTPLIYYFAMVPGQIWFRLLNIVWMSATTTFFYWITKRLFPTWLAFSTSLVFVLFTSLPWLEGHIPNGELFVMGFMLAGLSLLSKTAAFTWLITAPKKISWELSRRDLWLILAAGTLASLGILTKVPGILDTGALGSILFFVLVAHISLKNWRAAVWWFARSASAFVVGVIVPIVLSGIYYFARGAWSDYLQFGLLYNFHYSGNWQLPFTQEWLLFFFSLPGKALILAIALAISIVWAKVRPKHSVAAWIYFWTFAALFAATLSNRPYPHYLLQTIPPATLAVGVLLARRSHFISRILMIDAIGAIVVVALLLNFGFYETASYYSRYLKMATGQMTPAAYRASFDWLVPQNEEIVPIIVENNEPSDRIFVWGTNPMLYAQTQRAPASRFTVAFHVHDLKVYEETLNEVKMTRPKYVVVMKKESPLPGLDEFLSLYYLRSAETNDMILYRHTTLSSLDLLQ